MKKVLLGLLIFALTFILLAGLLFLYARYIEPSMLTVKNVPIKTNSQSARIIFFSDVHFGEMYPQDNIEKLVAKINLQEPDIVIFGGDFFDNYYRDKDKLDLEYIKAQLSKIQGKKFSVRGNHDYGGGAEEVFHEVMKDGGFTLLINQSELISKFDINIVGYDDYYFGETEHENYSLSTGKFNLLVAHEPIISTKVTSDSDGLALSGHTHGGQVSIPFLTDRFLPGGSAGFIKGLYEADAVNGKTPLYVTSGIGVTFLPFRLGNIPEIIVFDIGK